MEKVISFLSPTKGRPPRRSRSSQRAESTTLLPEVHRCAFLLFLKLLAPSAVTFLASETPLPTILGIWYPIIFTFYLLQRQQPRVIFGKAATNEQQLWLHYWSMVASWQFLRRTIINPALQSTFGIFCLLPWNMKQNLMSCLAQFELFGFVLLLYPIIHSKTWEGTIHLTTAQWNESSFIYRMWERHALSKIVTTEAILSLLASALASFSLAPSHTVEKDENDDKLLKPSERTPEGQQPSSDATSVETKSWWSYLEKTCEKIYQLTAHMISLVQWFGLISEETVASANALWSKVGRVPAGLVLPPLFLAVMPTSFCAQLGLQYLQWIYSASFSLKAASWYNTKDIAPNGNQGKMLEETYWLQYWIIHSSLVFGGLDYVSSQLPYWFKGLILWKFWLTLAWVWLLHDSLIVQSMFDSLATELVGLGLVADEVDSKTEHRANGQGAHQRSNIAETKTARFVQYLLQQLPRASTSSATETKSLLAMAQGKGTTSAREEDRSEDPYPDLTKASSSLSSSSSVSYPQSSSSSSPVASAWLADAERSAWTPSKENNSSSTPKTAGRSSRKKLLLRHRQQRSKQSSPS